MIINEMSVAGRKVQVILCMLKYHALGMHCLNKCHDMNVSSWCMHYRSCIVHFSAQPTFSERRTKIGGWAGSATIVDPLLKRELKLQFSILRLILTHIDWDSSNLTSLRHLNNYFVRNKNCLTFQLCT